MGVNIGCCRGDGVYERLGDFRVVVVVFKLVECWVARVLTLISGEVCGDGLL